MRVEAVPAPPAEALSSGALKASAVSLNGFFTEPEAGAAEAVEAVARPSVATQATARPLTARDRPGRCSMNQLLIDGDAVRASCRARRRNRGCSGGNGFQ